MSTTVHNPDGSVTVTISGNPPFVQTWYPPPGSSISQPTVPTTRSRGATKSSRGWAGTGGRHRKSRRHRKTRRIY